MKTVITNNGQFNITEELYESIVSNNPELLMERGGAEPVTADDLNSKENREWEQNLLRQVNDFKEKKSSDNSANNDNTASNESEDSKLKSQWDIIQNNPDIKARYKMVKQFINDNKDTEFYINNKKKITQALKKIRQDKRYDKAVNQAMPFYNALNNSERNNIKDSDVEKITNSSYVETLMNMMKENNYYILKRCIKKIEATLGLAGSLDGIKTSYYDRPEKYVVFNKSNDIGVVLPNNQIWSENGKKQIGEIDSNGEVVINGKVNKDASIQMMTSSFLQEHPKVIEVYFNDTPNENINKTEVNRRSHGIKAFSIMQGGVFVEPMGDKDSATKLYAAAVQDGSDTVISKLMNMRLSSQIRDKSQERKKKSDNMTKLDEFANMMDDFSYQIVKQLVVSKEENLNSVINTIRFDEFFTGKYTIQNMGLPTQFNIRREALKFINNKTKTIDAIIVVKPLIGAGLKTLKGYFDLFNNHVVQGKS